MTSFLESVFALSLSPFTSNSYLVWVPAAFAFIFGCVCLVFHFIRRL